jgi:hypothetical protein
MNLESFDHLVRREFRSFLQAGDAIRMSEDDRRRALELSEREWTDWSGVLEDGPVPAEPVLPEMLQRLGSVTYELATMAERLAA